MHVISLGMIYRRTKFYKGIWSCIGYARADANQGRLSISYAIEDAARRRNVHRR